jgi:hypothetical protein
MNVTETAEAAQRAASAVMYGGAGVSAASGGSMFIGVSVAQWQIVGIFGGLVLGLLGLVVNAAINFYFQYKRLKLAEAHARKGLGEDH